MAKKIVVRENFIDRAVKYVAPVAAAKRYRARAAMALAGDYIGADRSRRSMYGWNPLQKDADKTLEYQRQDLIDRSRYLTRNNPLVSGVIDDNCQKIIGSGLMMHSRVDRDILGISEEEKEAIETQIEREFALFASTHECDLARILNFYQLQELTLRQTFVAGESFTVLNQKDRIGSPYSLKIQIIEPDRINNKDRKSNGKQEKNEYLYDGVVKSADGEPLRYQISDEFPNMTLRSMNWMEIDAFEPNFGLRRVLHHYKMLRPGQTRGVPYLAPVIEPLHQLGKYSRAELDAAVVAALFTVFVKGVNPSSSTEGGLPLMQPTSETGGSSSDEDIKLGNAAIVELPDGKDISIANPGRPNSAYDQYVAAMYREIGVGLNIPYEVLVKHFQSSYSAARAALLEAWAFYMSRRKWLVESFCQPVYELFLFEAVARGRIYAPGFFADPLLRMAYCGAEWVGPAKGQIDPVKEANAMEKRLQIGITTTEMETAEYNGGHFDRNIQQIKKEIQMKKDAGLLSPPKPQKSSATDTQEDDNEPD